jgi:AcrR family transcriptional regulator
MGRFHAKVDLFARATQAWGMSQSSADLQDNGPRGAKRRQESRKRLLAAARKLFVSRGYHATRPQDISKAAGLGHGTFYLHFKDKRECFLAFVEDARAEIDAAVVARAADARSLAQFVEAVLTAIYDYAEEHEGVLVTALSDDAVIASGSGASEEDTLLHRWGALWAELLKTQAKEGLVAKDFDFSLLGQAIVGAIHQASSFSYKRGRSRAVLIKTLTQFIVRGLSPGQK